MNEEFVRKDIHDIEVRRLDERIDSAVLRMEARNEAAVARIEASLAEMKAQNAAFREQVAGELRSLRRDISSLESELKSEILKARPKAVDSSWNFAFTIIVCCLTLSIAVMIIQVWK